MTDTVCQIEALTLLRAQLAEPGVLRGPQRTAEFIEKIMETATVMVTRQTKPVREFARLGVRHRFPFAKEKTAKLCGVLKDTIARVLKILLKVGFLAGKSKTQRWYEAGSLRSITPGAKAYWRRPSIFQFGDKIACILAGTDLAASPFGSESALDVTPSLQEEELDDRTDQPTEKVEELSPEAVQCALPPSSPAGFEDDAVDDGVEAALEGFRHARVPSAMPDRRQAPAASPGDLLAALKAKADAGDFKITSLPPSLLGIFRRR